MPYLVTLVAVLVAATLLNLVLTIGVIRRLRDHTEQLAGMPGPDGFPAGFEPPARAMVPVGDRVADFTATSTEGETISREGLSGRTLVAFLSPDCPGCLDQVPHLADYAAGFPGGREQVVTVLGGTEEDIEAMRARLAPVSRIVVEPWGAGAIAEAFDMKLWPAFGLVDDDGTVIVAEGAVRELPADQPAVT